MSHSKKERLQNIYRFLSREMDKDNDLQELVAVISDLLCCPAAITLNEDSQQPVLHTSIPNASFFTDLNLLCRYMSPKNPLLIINDTLTDSRFEALAERPGQAIRFYAGASLCTHDGYELGCLLLVDIRPRSLSVAQQHLMRVLAKRMVQVIEFEMSINLLRAQFREAKDAEVKLRSVFESSDACHLLVNRDMLALDFNQQMADLFWNMHEAQVKSGTPIEELISGPDLADFVTYFNDALNGKAVRYQREVQDRNGEKIWWYVTYLPCFDTLGEVACVSYNAIDITEHMVHKELISVQNNSLKNIAFIQSHELRRPVATILGLMEVVKIHYGYVLPEEIKMLEEATIELDDKIREIVNMTV